MTIRLKLAALLLALVSIPTYAATNLGAEIVSYEKFGHGIMVTRAKIVPITGTVSNFFFFNREDQPWNGNVWYEYDWEIRGKFPKNGWSQIRVRPQAGETLRDAPVNVATKIDIGSTLYHWILIRNGDSYIYDVRERFDIGSYDYTKAAAHGGNSESLLTQGPREYVTGGNVKDIPSGKRLDFSLGITAFDNGWAGSLPNGSYTGDMVVDFARFYTFKNGSNSFNTSPQWSDEFNGNNIDYGKWLVANWTFAATQFSPQNVMVEDGFLTLRVNRDSNTAGPVSNTNLALSGTASQSSTYGGAAASRAIDGSTDGRYHNGSVTHSQFQTNAWWEVDLLGESEIDRISIHNRTDCCSDRLANYSVSVFDDNNTVIWSRFYSNHPSSVQQIDLDVRAKKVRINLVEGALSLAEVQVFGTGPTAPQVSVPAPVSPEPAQPSAPGITNLALAGTASQSTTAHNGAASRAIDNNTNGNWNAGSITHTRNRNDSWWQVELPSSSSINQIVLHNRTNCCSSRLSNFTVSVLDENGSEVWSQFFSNTPSPSLSINLNQTGKTVRVSLSGTLSLAEVEVFGSN